jgi:hypothetical protein
LCHVAIRQAAKVHSDKDTQQRHENAVQRFQISAKRLKNYQNEFHLLHYSLTGAMIFFRGTDEGEIIKA